MGCKEDSLALDSLKQHFCAESPSFPATAPLTAQDAAIGSHYGKACSSLSRLTGMQFKDGAQAYLCRSTLLPEKMEIANTPARGDVLSVFSEEAINQGDLLTRYGFTGVDFAAIVFDTTQKPLHKSADLKPLIASINSGEAAMAWAYLSGILGAGYHPQALCAAASITEGGSGWSVEKAERLVSCKPMQWVSFTVNRMGAISTTYEAEKINPDGTKSVICVD